MPHLSVILPCYNAEKTLSAAIDSIVRQSFTDWEMIVAEDGSSDRSSAIAAEWVRKDPRVRVLFLPHRGIVSALQSACCQARGEFIARMDADDISLPDRFEKQLEMFHTLPNLSLCGAKVDWMGDPAGSGMMRYVAWINTLTTHDEIVRELFVECPLPHPTFMMRRVLLKQLGGYRDNGLPEDYDLVLRVWEAGGQFAKPEPVLLRWRHHAARLSQNDPRYCEMSFRRLKRMFLEPWRRSLRERLFFQWGAGEVGKRWLREWTDPPRAVVDINPRKVGKAIHGVPVILPEGLPPPGACLILIAVGAPGARTEIREWLHSHAYEECRDYLFLA